MGRLNRSFIFMLLCFMVITSVTLARDVNAAIKSKSVWHQTNYNTISSRDLSGNKISFVCNRGTYDIYLSTFNRTTQSGARTYVSLWAAHDMRIKFRADARTSKLLKVRLNNDSNVHHLLFDMQDRYDLSVFVQGSRRKAIMLFALDGFADEFNKIC